jgi:hypothetical protein
MVNHTPDGPDPDATDQVPDQCPYLASDRYMEELAHYAETMVAHGREEVEKSFPRLAKHLSECSACTSVVEDMLAFLSEPGT